jgi:hypothetical protein
MVTSPVNSFKKIIWVILEMKYTQDEVYRHPDYKTDKQPLIIMPPYNLVV